MRLAVLLAALVLLVLPTAATGGPEASCQTKLRALQRQNLVLRQRLSAVIAQRNKAREERDTARAQLAAAQSGVAGAISTMAPERAWTLLSNPLSRVLAAPPRFSVTYFSSGGDYESWTFTNCGFCVPPP